MGGIYAREEGLPEQVWKAIYYHYLPVGVEADAPPSRQQLGRGGGHVGGGLARRQARHGRRAVRGRRAADRLARSVRPAAAGAGRGEDPGGPAGADRASTRRLTLGRAARRRPRRRSAAYGEPRPALRRVLARSRWRTCSSSAASTFAASGRSMHGGVERRRARSRRGGSSRRWRR